MNCVQEKTSGSSQSLWYFVVLTTTVLAVLWVRVRMLPLPLERDEGEYAYLGQQILRGILPFSEVGNMKLPGVSYMYALIMSIFGQTPQGIHIGLLLLHLAAAALLFGIARRWFQTDLAALATSVFLVLTAHPWCYGFSAHATHFVAFFSLTGVYLLVRNADVGLFERYGAGVLFGMAVLMKQHALFLAIFGSWLCVEQIRKAQGRNHLSAQVGFGSGVATPWLAVAGLAISGGYFDRFWYWTVSYAGQYVGQIGFRRATELLKGSLSMLTEGAALLWIAGIAGIMVMATQRKSEYRSPLIFVLLSLVTVVPGFYFRNHYFIGFYPAFALAIAVGLFAASDRVQHKWPGRIRLLPLLVALVLFVVQGYRQRFIYFTGYQKEVLQRYFGANPFIQSEMAAAFIRQHARLEEKVLVLGSEPQLYFLSRRKAATEYLYMYPMFENQKYSVEMQQNLIKEMELFPPWIIYVNLPQSWGADKNENPEFMAWLRNFTSSNYKTEAILDIPNVFQSELVSGDRLIGFQPTSSNYMVILRKNPK